MNKTKEQSCDLEFDKKLVRALILRVQISYQWGNSPIIEFAAKSIYDDKNVGFLNFHLNSQLFMDVSEVSNLFRNKFTQNIIICLIVYNNHLN